MCPGITSTSRSRTALEEHCLLAHDVSAGYQIAAQTEHSENRLSFKHQVVCLAFIFQHIFFIPDHPPFSSSFEVWVFPSRCSSVSCSFLHNIKHLWALPYVISEIWPTLLSLQIAEFTLKVMTGIPPKMIFSRHRLNGKPKHNANSWNLV